MELDTIAKVSGIVAAILVTITFILTQIMRFSVFNRFKTVNERNLLITNLESDGNPTVQVNHIALTGFIFWKQYPIPHGASTVLTVARKVDHVLNSDLELDNCSNYAIVDQTIEFPVRLEKYQSQQTIFDLDKLVDVYIETEETFGNRVWLLLTILSMKVEYNLNNSKVKVYHMDWRAKWYLIEQHLGNKNLYRP